MRWLINDKLWWNSRWVSIITGNEFFAIVLLLEMRWERAETKFPCWGFCTQVMWCTVLLLISHCFSDLQVIAMCQDNRHNVLWRQTLNFDLEENSTGHVHKCISKHIFKLQICFSCVSPLHLANHSMKWVWISHCHFWKDTEKWRL